jgi:hypothetical protein
MMKFRIMEGRIGNGSIVEIKERRGYNGRWRLDEPRNVERNREKNQDIFNKDES